MKLSCLQENLAKGLGIVSRAASTRSTLPVLGNVLLATDNGRLKLMATNLETAVVCWIGAMIEEQEAVTVPVKTLGDLVKSFPAERVDLELNAKTQTMNIVCGRTKANVKGITADEFPLLVGNLEEGVCVEAAELKLMISQVAFAVAKDDSRPVLSGVSVVVADGKITMAATDGFRLSVREGRLEKGKKEWTAVVPARALMEVARLIGDEMEKVWVSMPNGSNQIAFDMENVLLVSQLIGGKFPDYEPIIPTQYRTRAIFETVELRQAFRMAAIFAREGTNTATLKIQTGDEDPFAIVSAESDETGNNVIRVEAIRAEGNWLEIWVNVQYLIEVLGTVKTPTVVVKTEAKQAPIVIQELGNNDFLHIVMPMAR